MTIVLVHAAWADASNWSQVLLRLRALGSPAIAVQLPLTSLADDVAALRRSIGRVEGPVVLAAHSYGGAVITAAATGLEKVKGLVYIAAMAPDEGETVAQLLHRAEPHPQAPALAPDADGNLWMSEAGFAAAVAPDSSAEEIFLMAAAQKPTSIQCILEPMTAPAWKQIPSWYLLAERDRVIAPATQRFMAERAGARIESRDVDHSPTTSAPVTVAEAIQSVVRVLVPGSRAGAPAIAPPFSLETATRKVQMAEDAWNSRDPERVSLAYSLDSVWRNRTEFLRGRDEIKAFLKRKWAKEHDYKLRKTLWGFRGNRIAVSFEYEWRDDNGQWFRSYGNELWEFDEEGLMRERRASINDAAISCEERRIL
jgi:nuclear transport factor 2 (NTF2) superfamily protein/pimeloyl-ACP methyl ester carboxylesterase